MDNKYFNKYMEAVTYLTTAVKLKSVPSYYKARTPKFYSIKTAESIEQLLNEPESVEDFMDMMDQLDMPFDKEKVKKALIKSPFVILQGFSRYINEMVSEQVIPVKDYRVLDVQPMATANS